MNTWRSLIPMGSLAERYQSLPPPYVEVNGFCKTHQVSVLCGECCSVKPQGFTLTESLVSQNGFPKEVPVSLAPGYLSTHFSGLVCVCVCVCVVIVGGWFGSISMNKAWHIPYSSNIISLSMYLLTHHH
jgi:hypothetical protein